MERVYPEESRTVKEVTWIAVSFLTAEKLSAGSVYSASASLIFAAIS